MDGRLLVAAGAAWLGSAATQIGLDHVVPATARHGAAVTVLGCGGALAVVAAIILIASASRRSGRRVALGVIGLLAAFGSLSGSWLVSVNSGWPLAGWTNERVTATIDGLVTGEPEQRRPSLTQSWQSNFFDVRLATSRISARGETVDVGVPVIVRTSLAAVVPPPGTRVRVVGRLSTPPTRDASAAVTAVSAHPFVVVATPGPLDAAAHAMRRALRSAVAGVPSDAGAVVAGLATGDDALQSAELAADMRASGLSHLTAVSGGNVAVVLALVLGLAAALRLSLVVRVAVALLALVGFVVLVGPQPSVLRAAVMGGVVVVALLAGGRRNGPSLLATAVVLLVLTNPPLALSWGFALSVFATGGLILLAPPIDTRLAGARLTGRWPPALRRTVALTVAAQIATLPLLVAMGSVVGWVSLPANLLAMPAVAPVTIAGLGAAVVGPLQPELADWLAQVAAVPAAWIAWVAHSCVRLPFASLPWPAGPVGAMACVLAIALAVGGVAALRRIFPDGIAARTKLIGAAVLVPVLLLWLLAPPGRRAWPPHGWFLIMCDVGQGDALLLRDGPGSAVVVDTGPDPRAVDRCLHDARVATVSALVLTHFHADHVDGLAGVLRGEASDPCWSIRSASRMTRPRRWMLCWSRPATVRPRRSPRVITVGSVMWSGLPCGRVVE